MNYLLAGVFETISLFVSSVNCCHPMISLCCYIFTFCFHCFNSSFKNCKPSKNVKPKKLLFGECFNKRENKTKQNKKALRQLKQANKQRARKR